MNTTINKVIGVVAAIALVVGVVAYNKTPTAIVGSQGAQGPKGESVVGPRGPAGKDGVTTVITKTEAPKLGSVSSPDIPSPYLQYGGVREWAYKITSMATGSTSCSFMAPPATTTLKFAIATYTLASTTVGSVVEIGQSISPNATTTSIATTTAAQNVQFTLQNSATSTFALSNNNIVTPSTFINVKIGGGAGTYAPTGSCVVGFREVQ